MQIVVIDPPKKHPKLSFGAQPFHVNPKHHGKKTGIVSRLQERGAEEKWRRKEVGCALPTPGPPERSAFHIKEHRRKTPRPGPPAPASFPKARSMLPADRAQQEKKLAEFLCSCLPWGGRVGAEGLGGRGARRPWGEGMARRPCTLGGRVHGNNIRCCI